MIDINSWVSGMIDGEGSFYIQKGKRNDGVQKGYIFYCPVFNLGLSLKDNPALEKIKEIIGGKIYYKQDKRVQVTDICYLRIRDKKGRRRLIDFLTQYPLQSSKKYEYEIWKQACEKIEDVRNNTDLINYQEQIRATRKIGRKVGQ